MEILRTENLSKVYDGKYKVQALDQVNLSVEKGSLLAIVGDSGSGKSTLLHILGGVDHPTSGRVFVQGTDITELSESEMSVFRRRNIGIIYQFFNLIPNINVRKNICLPLLLDRRNKVPPTVKTRSARMIRTAPPFIRLQVCMHAAGGRYKVPSPPAKHAAELCCSHVYSC